MIPDWSCKSLSGTEGHVRGILILEGVDDLVYWETYRWLGSVSLPSSCPFSFPCFFFCPFSHLSSSSLSLSLPRVHACHADYFGFYLPSSWDIYLWILPLNKWKIMESLRCWKPVHIYSEYSTAHTFNSLGKEVTCPSWHHKTGSFNQNHLLYMAKYHWVK